MNGRTAKYARQKARKEWKKKLSELKNGSFLERVAVSWWLIFGN